MKFLKMLFGRLLPVIFFMLVQLAAIVLAVIYLEAAYPVFQLFSVIVALLVFLVIVNKRENPEFKLPWLVLLFVLPFFTVLSYILFANPRMPRPVCERALEAQRRTSSCMAARRRDDEELCGEVRGIERYLASTAYMRGHMHNRVTYYGTGEEFWAALLEELEGAQKYIFMEYFIIDRGKMWDSILDVLVRKAAAGVEVRLMYDDIGTVGMLRGSYYRELRKKGINCRKFNPFRPVVSGIHNNRDHRKITVVDGRVGFTGGINLGDEYVNENRRLGHWKDTAIKIEGSAVDNLVSLFLQMFDMSSGGDADYLGYYAEHEKFADEGYVHPFGDGPAPLFSELVGENIYIDLINAAHRYCYITTPYLIPDYNVISALRSAALRGVDVRIVTPHIPDKRIVLNMTRSNYGCLIEAGVKIYEYTPGFVHAKMLVADDKWAFVGTINLDYRSLVHHYECGAVMYGTPCIADIKRDFDETIKISGEITRDNFKIGPVASAVNAVLKLFSPLM